MICKKLPFREGPALRSLLASTKPRVMALLSLLALAGAALSPHFLSPAFPTPPLSMAQPFLWFAARWPALFTPPLWSLAHALGAAAVTALLWASVALVNDLSDAAIDRIANPERLKAAEEPVRRRVLRWAVLLQAAALLLAACAGSRGALALVATGSLLGHAYSVPPIRFRRSGLAANGAIGAGVFLALVGGAAAQYAIPPSAWTTGAVLGMLAFAASMVKDFKDVEGDAPAGIRTLPVLLGHERAVRVNIALVATAYGGAAAMLAESHLAAAALLLLLAGAHILLLRRLLHDRSAALRRRAYRLALLLFMGVTAVYVGAQILFRH
jgi:chlorophyll/bacteriochlorophyll a synthase